MTVIAACGTQAAWTNGRAVAPHHRRQCLPRLNYADIAVRRCRIHPGDKISWLAATEVRDQFDGMVLPYCQPHGCGQYSACQ